MNTPSEVEPVNQPVEVKIRPNQIAIAAIIVVAVFAGALLVLRLVDVLVLVFIGLVISSSLRPLVSALQQRGIPKMIAVMAIYVCILGFLAGFIVLVVPVLANQGGALMRSIPGAYSSLVFWLKENPNEVLRGLPTLLPSGEQLSSQLQLWVGPF